MQIRNNNKPEKAETEKLLSAGWYRREEDRDSILIV